jgi:tetratricopeptide (TPR) repeat protein
MEFERNALCSMLMDLMTNFASRLASAPPKVAQKDLDVFKTIVGDIQRYKFVSDVLRGREDELASHTREPKNDNEANAARERGNDLFKRGSYAEALKAYNEGIVYDYAAPESLPLFFANRSAVLVELNRPGDALKDIDRAFAYGYQKNIAFKLHFRKAKILLELGNVQDASKEVQDGKDSLSLLSVDAVTAEWGRRFDELETDLSNTKRRKERKKSKLPGGRGSPKSYFEDYRVNYSPHPTYVSASATVDVRYSKENGRSMYAKKDLKPGESEPLTISNFA